jgi:hypothetical protein
MEVKTVKFELYPQDNPTGYAVGFHLYINNKTVYRDILVTFSEISNKTDEEIIQYSWSKLKESLNLDELKLQSNKSILGKTFIVNDENNLEEITSTQDQEEINIGDPLLEEDSP